MAASLESIRSNLATQSVTSPVGAEVMASRRGHYRGESVRGAADNSRLTASSSSEARAAANNPQKLDLRSLQIRAARQGQATNPVATARIADYLDKLPDLPAGDKLQALAQEFETVMVQAPPMHLTEHVGKHVAERLHAEAPKAEGAEVEDRAELPEQEAPGESGGEGQSREAPGLTRADWVRTVRDQLLERLEAFDGDVTHQFAALELMADHFEASGAGDAFLEALGEARQSFEQTEIARDVRAGFAAATVAHQAAETLETDPRAVRDAYRSLLRDTPDLGTLFEKLANFDLSGKYDTVISTFLDAAGRDLAGIEGGIDARFLGALMQELSKLKTMRTVLEGSQTLVRDVSQHLFPNQYRCVDAIRLTKDMLHFAAKTAPTPQDVRQMFGPCELAPEIEVMLGNGIRHLHGRLPDGAVANGPARLQQAAAIMVLLDQVVEKEEAAYAAAAQPPAGRT